MEVDTLSAVTIVFVIAFEWILFSLGLWRVEGKLGREGRTKAFIPGVRWAFFGDSLGMNKEGIACGVLDVIFILIAVTRVFVPRGQVGVAMSLLTVVLFIFLFIYRIRIYFRLLDVFGLKKTWVIVWLIANWLPMLIIGFGAGFVPGEGVVLEENWEAGTKPADIPGTGKASRRAQLKKEGLSVNLRERTAKDGGKKRYLLKDIDLDIPKNSLVLLLGGSGAGKTTLVNALIGYEKADATVLLNGADVYKEYNSVKHKIGFVPQQNLIRGKDTVWHTVKDAAEMRLPASLTKEEKQQKITEVMDLLGLSAGQEGLVCKKSGGQLRRICIAMELVTDPDLFVLDEPDSGLDGVISREIFQKLRGIADEGRIVIVITHTPDRVIDLFDKVIVLGRDSGRCGRLAFYGSPQEAREFFGKETMEQIVMSVNSSDEGGEGMADTFIEKYAEFAALREEGAAS